MPPSDRDGGMRSMLRSIARRISSASRRAFAASSRSAGTRENPLRSPQAGFGPEIVPIVMIVRAQMLGAEPGRQQAVVQAVPATFESRLRSIQRTALSIDVAQRLGQRLAA